MAKKERLDNISDLDFSEFDQDFNDDLFGDGDTGPNNSRKPTLTGKTKELLRESATQKFQDARYRREVLKKSLPSEYTPVLADYDTISKEVGNLWRDQQKAWEKERGNIKRAIKPFGELAGSLGFKRLEKWVNEEERSRTSGPSDDELDELKIQSIIQETFGAYNEEAQRNATQMEAVRQEREDGREADAQADREANAKRGIESNAYLSEINKQSAGVNSYNKTVDFPYKKRSLELQARLLINSQRQLTTMMSFKDLAIKELQDIHKNTGLPDYLKITPMEMTKQALGMKIAGGLTKPFENVGSKAAARVFGKIRGEMTEWWKVIGESVSSINMFNQEASEDDMEGNAQTPLGQITKLLTGGASDWVTGIAADKANNYISPKIRNYLEKKHGVRLFGSSLKSMGNQFGGLFNEALKSGQTGNGALDAFIRMFDLGSVAETGSRLVIDNSQLDLDKAAQLDQKFKLSVTDVIPGWLERIFTETYRFNNGGKTPESTVWDFNKSKFVSSSSKTDEIMDAIVSKDNIIRENEAVDRYLQILDPDRVMSSKTFEFVRMWVVKEKRASNALNPLKLLSDTLNAPKDVKAELLVTIPHLLKLDDKQVQMVADGSMASLLAASFKGGDAYRNVSNSLAESEAAIRSSSSLNYDAINKLSKDSDATRLMLKQGILIEGDTPGQYFLNPKFEDKAFRSYRNKNRRQSNIVYDSDGGSETVPFKENWEWDDEFKLADKFSHGTMGMGAGQKAYRRYQQLVKEYGYDPMIQGGDFKRDRNGNIFTNNFIITKEGRVIYAEDEKAFSRERKRLKFAAGGKVPKGGGRTKGEPSSEIDVTLHGGEQVINADATKTNVKLLNAINKYGASFINADGSINSVYHKLFGFKSAKDFNAGAELKDVKSKVKAHADEQTEIVISSILKNLTPTFHKTEDLAFIVDKKNPLNRRLAKTLDLFKNQQVKLAKEDPTLYAKNLGRMGINKLSDKFDNWIDRDQTGVNVKIKNSLIDHSKQLGKKGYNSARDLALKTRFLAKSNLLDRNSTLNSVRSAIDTDVSNKPFERPTDIYMEGRKNPILLRLVFAEGGYIDQNSGQRIKKPSDITGTVINRTGDVVVTTSDLYSGKFYTISNGHQIPFKFLGIAEEVRKYTSSKEFVKGRMDIVKNSERYKEMLDKANAARYKFLQDKPIDIYLRGGKEPILRATGFTEGLYIDQNSGDVLWSHHDITGPVIDKDKTILLSAEQLADGLFTVDGVQIKISKIKQYRNKAFRRGGELYNQYAARHVNKIRDKGLNMMSAMGERVVGMNYDNNPIDVYVSGETEPRITAAQFKVKVVVDMATGDVIKSHSGIKGPVGILKADLTNIAITKEELGKLVDANGEALYLPLTKTASGRFVEYLKEAALPRKHFKRLKNFIDMSPEKRHELYMKKIKEANLAYDVYVTGDPVTPLLTKVSFDKGEYTSQKTGKVLLTPEFIDGPVLDAAGNVVVTEDHIKKGLVTRDGKKVSIGFDPQKGGLLNNIKGAMTLGKRFAIANKSKLSTWLDPKAPDPDTPAPENIKRTYTLKFRMKKGLGLSPSLASINNRTFSDDDINAGLLVRTTDNGDTTVVTKVEDIDSSTWLLYPTKPKVGSGINFQMAFEEGGYLVDQDGKTIITQWHKQKYGKNYGLSMKRRFGNMLGKVRSWFSSKEENEEETKKGGFFSNLFSKFRKGSWQEQEEQKKKDKKDKDGKPTEVKEKKDSWMGRFIKRLTLPLTLLLGGLASGISGLQASLLAGVAWLGQSLVAGRITQGLGSAVGSMVGGRAGMMGKVFKGALIGGATYGALNLYNSANAKDSGPNSYGYTNADNANLDTTSKVLNMAGHDPKNNPKSAGNTLESLASNPLLTTALVTALTTVGPGKLLKGLWGVGKAGYNVGKAALGGLGTLAGKGLGGLGRFAAGRAPGTAGALARGAGAVASGLGKVRGLATLGSIASGVWNVAKFARLLTPWGLGATALYYGGKWAYGLWKDAKNPWNRFRMAQYGFDHKDSELMDKIAKIEAASSNIITVTKDGKAKLKADDKAFNEILKICGFKDEKGGDIPDQQERLPNFAMWYRERFVRIYASYLTALQSIKGKAEMVDLSKLNRSEQLELMKQVHFTNLDSSPYSITQSPFEDPNEAEYDASDVDNIAKKVTWKIKELPPAPPVVLKSGDGVDSATPPKALPKTASAEEKIAHEIDKKIYRDNKISDPKTMVDEANKTVKLQTDAAKIRAAVTQKQMEVATKATTEQTEKAFDESSKSLASKFKEFITGIGKDYASAWEKLKGGDVLGAGADFLNATTMGASGAIGSAVGNISGKVGDWVGDQWGTLTGKPQQTQKDVFNAFRSAGLSENQAKAITAEVGRENDYKESVIYGSHVDPATRGGVKVSNLGMLSWNGSRGVKLYNFLKSKGLIDANGKMVKSREALQAQAQFAVSEMRDPYYADKLKHFWSQPNADPESFSKELGKGYVVWAYGQDSIAAGAGRKKFNWKTHDAKRRGYLTGMGPGLNAPVGGGPNAASTAIPPTIARPSSGLPPTIVRPGTNPINVPNVSGNIFNAGNAIAGMAGNKSPSGPQATIYQDPKAIGGQSNASGRSSSWNVDAICNAALRNAKPGSIKKCAEYVRKALQAGDMSKAIKGGMGHAWEFMTNLPKIGWKPIGNIMTCRPQKGDICVFPKYTNLVKNGGSYGHVCIYTGSQWVSDFVQATMYPSSRLQSLPHMIFRAGDIVNNGATFGDVNTGIPAAVDEPLVNATSKPVIVPQRYSSYNSGGTAVQQVNSKMNDISNGSASPTGVAEPFTQINDPTQTPDGSMVETNTLLQKQLTVQEQMLEVLKTIAGQGGVNATQAQQGVQDRQALSTPNMNAVTGSPSPFNGIKNPISVMKPS